MLCHHTYILTPKSKDAFSCLSLTRLCYDRDGRRPPCPSIPTMIRRTAHRVGRPASTFAFLLLHVLTAQLHLARSGDSGIPVAKSYRAFGPLSLGSRGGSPLSVLGTDMLDVLATVQKFPSECATGGYATWRSSSPYNASDNSGTISIPFSDAELPYESYAIANFSLPNTVQAGTVPQVLRCSRPALIRSPHHDRDVHCAPDVYDDGRALCPITLNPNVVYTILVHMSSGSNTSSLSCNYFYPPEANADRSLLIPLNDSVGPSVVVEMKNVQAKAERVPPGQINVRSVKQQSFARLAGAHCSVTVLNAHDDNWATAGTAKIVDAPPGISLSPQSSADEHYPLPRLAPKQIRQLRLDLAVDPAKFLSVSSSAQLPESISIIIEIRYEFRREKAPHRTTFNLSLPVTTWQHDRSYHFTYVDVDGSIQAAAVLPPTAPCAPNCTVLLSTHGAGVDAVAAAWTESYRTQKSAWVLLPTGRRKFGLNWEGPQMRTAITAVRAFCALMPGVPPDQASYWKPRNDAWLQAGHSMGGHGALLLATHFPDMLLASLPAAGWLRLSTYGESGDSEDLSYSDASLRALLAVSSAEYNADLYAENLLGIPFLARVGSEDDNVPPSNLRKFCRLLKENEFFHNVTTVVNLSEVPGKGHWFDGVVDDDVLQPFLDKHLNSLRKPALPLSFTVFTMNPGSSGSRGGLRVLLQEVVFEQSRLHVRREGVDWHVQTENVRRFRYQAVNGIEERPQRLYIDGEKTHGIAIPAYVYSPRDIPELEANDDSDIALDFCATNSNSVSDDQRPVRWRLCDRRTDNNQRLPDLYGPSFSVLSRRKVVVIYPEKDGRLRDFAVRYSNALYIRGISAAVTTDSNVTAAGQMSSSPGDFNTILLGGPNINSIARMLSSSGHTADVWFDQTEATAERNTTLRFCVADRRRCFSEPGTGIAFLSKGPGRSLLFYAAGTDAAGVEAALDFLPYSPSSHIPEWTILSVSARGWGFRGLGGVVALGYWDSQWKLEPRKSYPAEFVFDAKEPGVTCARTTPLWLRAEPTTIRRGGFGVIGLVLIAAVAIWAMRRREKQPRRVAPYARVDRNDPDEADDDKFGRISQQQQAITDMKMTVTTSETCAIEQSGGDKLSGDAGAGFGTVNSGRGEIGERQVLLDTER